MFGLRKKTEKRSGGGLWQQLRSGLAKTRAGLTTDLAALILDRGKPDAEVLEEIETRLLLADVGVTATARIISGLDGAIKRRDSGDLDAVLNALREQMLSLLAPVAQPLRIDTAASRPSVILVVGVNGVGKTTTIGKLGRRFADGGLNVVLAAADTFRAAAVEQLQVWGQRCGAPVISQGPGADAAAVVFDSLQSARARAADLVIVDTAGRLHNKDNLMAELKKIRRAVDKFDAALVVETLLVIDGGTGQNALAQARRFHDAVGLTGMVLTKLDGTAKGGIVFALATELSIPVRFVGVGEQADDLRPFVAGEFVDALLGMGA